MKVWYQDGLRSASPSSSWWLQIMSSYLATHWCNSYYLACALRTQRSHSNQNDRQCFRFQFCQSTPFLLPLVSSGSTSVSEPDSELSARSDIPERSFLRGIKISYEIVLDSAWQVLSFSVRAHTLNWTSFRQVQFSIFQSYSSSNFYSVRRCIF